MNRIRPSRRDIIGLALCLTLLGGCDERAQKVPRVEGVTMIRVYGPSADPARTIDDAEEMARVVAFINERRSGWHVPEVDAPLPAVTAVLYGGGKKYTFSAAPEYFSSGPVYLLSRRASLEEFQEFLNLVGIADLADSTYP
jgi:hypothetical protein